MNKKNLLIAALAMLAGAIAAKELPPELIAFAERPSAIYRVGEKIRFKIWLIQPQKEDSGDPEDPDRETLLRGHEILWEVTGDGDYRKSGSLISGKKAAVVEAELKRPGFVLLKAVVTIRGRQIVRFAGAGVDPEKIVAGTTMPADFESYWRNRIAKMRARKPEITVREITDNYSRSYREMVKIFDVRIADGEINATGILTVPRWPGREKMPAIITFGGASWMGARVFLEEAVARGAIVFHMNIHDTTNHVDEKLKQELRKRPDIKVYQCSNLLDREEYIPGRIFLRVVRSLDYLKSRPEWNGRDLIAVGPSFGGCQSIVAAALDKDVTLCCPGAPAMCDHLGSRNHQANGWPQLLKRFASPPEKARLAAENSAYFDAANMARLIRCPVGFSVGFIDQVCPPTSVYAAYNNVPVKEKRMIHATRAAHGSSLKPREPNAFSSSLNPLYREICTGTEMLVNGSFRYCRFDGEKPAPHGWLVSGEAVVHGAPARDDCRVRLAAGTRLVQYVFNVRGKALKVVLKGSVRGKGVLTIRLDGAGEPYVCRSEHDGWREFRHEFDLPEGFRSRRLEFRAAEGTPELRGLSLKY